MFNYAMANGVIAYDRLTESPYEEQMSALGIPLTGDYYYSFLNNKVKLTELGIYVLESIRSIRVLKINHLCCLMINLLIQTHDMRLR